MLQERKGQQPRKTLQVLLDHQVIKYPLHNNHSKKIKIKVRNNASMWAFIPVVYIFSLVSGRNKTRNKAARAPKQGLRKGLQSPVSIFIQKLKLISYVNQTNFSC